VFLGYGNASERGPIGRDWCIQRVTIQFILGSTWGRVRLLDDNEVVRRFTCSAPDVCPPDPREYDPPRLVEAGSVLRYDFRCDGDPSTAGDECADELPDGATIKIDYVVRQAP
jgi:hypothetical protein